MIKALQRRFVLTAMLSLFVLLVILIGGIIGTSYFSMERSTDLTIEMLSDNRPPAAPNEEQRRPMFGYQINPSPRHLMNYAVVIADDTGEIVSIDTGFQFSDVSEINDYALSILDTGKTTGKIGSFKYRLTLLADGGFQIIFLDVSAQAQMLADTVRVSCLIGAVCMALMLIILMLVSRRTVLPIADNIEKQRRFVTDAGHEIKTPLAIIQANVDAMELHHGPSKWSKHIREQASRLDGLMKQLLSLAKMDEGEPTLLFEDILFSELVEKSILAFSELEGGKEIRADIVPHISIFGNRDGLEQLVFILLDNAVKYSAADGAISVRLAYLGNKKVLEVVNTCSALPDAQPHTLFDRFYRADTARTQKSGGYGIGLSIARAITKIHKGKIAAFYDDEHTIRFCIEL